MLVYVTLGVWLLCEGVLRVRERSQGRGRLGHDRFSRILIGLAAGGSVGLANAVRRQPHALLSGRLAWVGGLCIIWLGLGVRFWAVAVLGRSFRTTVEVEPDQDVVSRGPYRWVRHPSYTGLLLIVVGFGVTTGRWVAAIVCLVAPLAALLWRIHVEEAELERVLGDAYRSYEQGTERLIPHIW
jgi:protein-S-isoprenylcysteine O-methyltransferase Ste14